MESKILFNKALIQRYDYAGPRYTSYPTAKQFVTDYNDNDYIEWITASNEDPIPASLSLYLHIPFCDTICYYCGCSKIVTKDKSKAAPYLALLKKEIAMQGKLFADDREVSQIHWGGGTPTFLDDAEIADIMTSLRQHFHVTPENGEFGIEVDPRTVDANRIRHLRELGFNRISFGVQDFDANVQQAVNRVHSSEQIMQSIRAARDNHFESINIDLMYGLPEQTPETFSRSLDATIEADPDRLAVYNYAHMPEMFKPQRRINASALPTPEQKLAILQLTIDKLQNAGYVYIGMDHFAKASDALVKAQQNGSLHRNFQGYSTHANCDIIAMGITAISRVGDNYCQNVRTIDEYRQRLDAGRFAVFRGIELEPDDVLRREIINKLMCNNYLDIEKLEQKWGIHFLTYF
ncbi:MAG TPA: oxygen-independent coproporphyrinogen III oxidase, partial [Thiotrichales bacterium]|nr:oxygen-independent coproporphyrinogen III oxidase [Thiotrichales bacterium]